MNIQTLLIAGLTVLILNGLQASQKEVKCAHRFDGTTMSGKPVYLEWLAARGVQGKPIANAKNYQNNIVNNKEISKK